MLHSYPHFLNKFMALPAFAFSDEASQVNAALAQFQRQLLAALRDRRQTAVLKQLAPGRFATPDAGLAIYQHAYRARLCEALESDHSLLGNYLGDALWHQLCDQFIDAHPSNVTSLRHFGAALPDFLSQAPPFAAQPQIAELARFERRLMDCFDAKDLAIEHAPASWNALLQLPQDAWPGLRVNFYPSLIIHETRWNSVEIWRALKTGIAPPSAIEVPGVWVLWRDQALITRFRSLALSDVSEAAKTTTEVHAEVAAIAHFASGGDFASVCTLLLNWYAAEQVPMIAITFLQQWSAQGWIARWVSVS